MLFFPGAPASAYSLNLAEREQDLGDPEAPAWYFGELAGESNTYRVTEDDFFRLEMRLLVPERFGTGARYGATVFWVDEAGREPVAALTGGVDPWTEVTERYTGEKYLVGPEFRKRMAPGTYEIEVGGNDNYGRYVLALGGESETGLGSALEVVKIMPRIKEVYFGESPVTFLSSWFARVYVALSLVIGFLLGLLWFTALRALDYRHDRICVGGRRKQALVRLGLAGLLVVWAVSSSWNPTLFLLSGILLFDAFRKSCSFKRKTKDS